MKKLPMPTSVRELWTVWRELEGNAIRPSLVHLYSNPGQVRDDFLALFLKDSAYPERLRVIEPEQSAPLADINLIVLEDEAELPRLSGVPMESILAILVGVPDHLAVTRQREIMRAYDLVPQQVLLLADLKKASEITKLSKRLFMLFPDLTIPLARQFPVFRMEASWQEIEATAKQNAVVGLIPIPGGDMPLMTANQMKMILRVAAMFDLPITRDRLKEIAIVIGGGFGFRTAARQIVKFIPGPGWIVGGSIGYTGTLAMGKAAIEYFLRVSKNPEEQVAS